MLNFIEGFENIKEHIFYLVAVIKGVIYVMCYW